MKNTDSAYFQPVCRVGDVPEGEGGMFVVAETMIGVFNLGGSFFALANECPHAGASLAHGVVENEIVCCRIHHWRFSIRDGAYLDEDKPQCNLQTFPVRVVGNEVHVEFVADEY